MIRKPAVAGSFYPANAKQLQAIVNSLLLDAKTGDRVPKAIIAPHAGYIYSGAVAASAYARLIPSANAIDKVVLLGPSHRVAFRGLAVSRCQAYSTPLGDIELDTTAIESLLSFPFVDYLDEAHAQEHSLEVHLPFLQTVLRSFKLTPIVVGDASPEQVCQVLEKLWDGDATLIVISSDLSHFHDYPTAQHLDHGTSHLIETLAYNRINGEHACGKAPINGLLKLLADKSLKIKTIDLRNSGDTAGDKRRVVGYGAYVVD